MAAQRTRQERQRRRVPARHCLYRPRVGGTEGLPRSYPELDLIIGNDRACRKQCSELVGFERPQVGRTTDERKSGRGAIRQP
jgi:hypothetical protein